MLLLILADDYQEIVAQMMEYMREAHIPNEVFPLYK